MTKSSEKKRRIGIMGGTFNPPHFSHLKMAAAALLGEPENGILPMEEIIWVPNGDPPHKLLEVSKEDRLEMVSLLIRDEARMRVSDLEIRRRGRSYMADTLEELAKEMPDAELWLLCGADMLFGLSSWYRADEVFSHAGILAFAREGEFGLSMAVRFLKEHGARVEVMHTLLPDISSTRLRELLSQGGRVMEDEEIEGVLTAAVPPAVLSYIRERGLYQHTIAE